MENAFWDITKVVKYAKKLKALIKESAFGEIAGMVKYQKQP